MLDQGECRQKYLLSVWLGPVQEYIAEARKTRDLWVGSYLLSRMAYELLAPLVKSGCTVIFPDITGSPIHQALNGSGSAFASPQAASLPNRFLVVVKASGPDGVRQLMSASVKNAGFDKIEKKTEAAKGYWARLASDIEQRISISFSKAISSKGSATEPWNIVWDRQVNDLWQCMWVAVPVQDNSEYSKAVTDIQSLMATRKLTRTFDQWQGSPAPKCSQCGIREALGPENMSESSRFWRVLHERMSWKIRRNDKLCSSCTIKRFIEADEILPGLQEPRFDSTRDIAVRPYAAMLDNKLDQSERRNLLKAANSLSSTLGYSPGAGSVSDIPGNLLYREDLDPPRLRKDYSLGATAPADLSTQARDLADILGKIDKIHGCRPSRYYALLFVDGDDIGDWMSGQRPAGASFDIQEHQRRSRILGELGTKTIPPIIENLQGAAVYSGGDDVLALSPLDHVLSMAREVRMAYRGLAGEGDVTASAGIVIVHSSDSLARALEDGRVCVRAAKESFRDKNAFRIKLRLGAGATIEGGWQWSITQDGTAVDVIEKLLKPLIEWIKGGQLSPRYIYDLQREAVAFTDPQKSFGRFNRELFIEEATRLFYRHWRNKQETKEMPWRREKRADIENVSRLGRSTDGAENIIGLLRIAAFIARESVAWKP